MTPKMENGNNCDINRSEDNNTSANLNPAIRKDMNHGKTENTNARKKSLTSPYAVSNPVVIDKREGNRNSSENKTDLPKHMNENSNIGLPPNEYILPGKMKLGNALNILALNSVYLGSIPQNSRYNRFIKQHFCMFLYFIYNSVPKLLIYFNYVKILVRVVHQSQHLKVKDLKCHRLRQIFYCQ